MCTSRKKSFFAIHTDRIEAQHFFDAMPVGLFPGLDGIQVEGHIQYDLNFCARNQKARKASFLFQKWMIGI
jgi:hypothetical protein